MQNELNVPNVRFKEYIDDLEQKKFIMIETEIALTERGPEYLKEYGKVRVFLEKFGMISAWSHPVHGFRKKLPCY